MQEGRKNMSTFQDLLNETAKESSGSKITITKEWCDNHGLISDGNIRRRWGSRIGKNPMQYGLIPDNIINPGCGKFSNKSSDNLSHYIKN